MLTFRLKPTTQKFTLNSSNNIIKPSSGIRGRMHQVHEYPHLNINYIGYIELQIVLMHAFTINICEMFLQCQKPGYQVSSVIIFHSSAGMYGPKLRKT